MRTVGWILVALVSAGCGADFNEINFASAGKNVGRVWGTGADDVWTEVVDDIPQNGPPVTHFMHWNGSSATRVEVPALMKSNAVEQRVTDMAPGAKGETWLSAVATSHKAMVFVSMNSSGAVVDHSDFFPALAPADSADVYAGTTMASRDGVLFVATGTLSRGPILMTVQNGVATNLPAPAGALPGAMNALAIIAANDLYAQAPTASSGVTKVMHWDGTAWSDVMDLQGTPRAISVFSPTEVWLWDNNMSVNPAGLYTVFRRDGATFTAVEVTVKVEPSVAWQPVGLVAQGGGRFSFIANALVPVEGAPGDRVIFSRTYDGKTMSDDHRLTAETDCKNNQGFPGVCAGGIDAPTQLTDGTVVLRVGGLVVDPLGPVRVFTLPRSAL